MKAKSPLFSIVLIKKIILPCLMYTIYLFIFLEILARFIFFTNSKFLYKISDRSTCEATERIKWIQRPQKGLTDIFDSTKGWALKPNLRDTLVSSNSTGIRGKTEYSYNKIPGKARILILGDSFTFGGEVSDNETYPFYLQQMVPNCEAINFGVYGYGHDQMLVYLKEEGLKYKPDII